MSPPPLRVRAAYPRDVPALVEFNLALARETEDLALDPARLKAGIEAVFADPARGTYWVALRDELLVGGLLVTHEWSDWRNGVFWWIQSVYVVPDARRGGVFRALYENLVERCRSNPEVCGLRLYVDRENRRAQGVYRELGMDEARYRLFERDFVLERH